MQLCVGETDVLQSRAGSADGEAGEDGCRGPGNSITAHRKRQIESPTRQEERGGMSGGRDEETSVKEREKNLKMDKGRFANHVSFWLSSTLYFIMFQFRHSHPQSHFTVLIL